MSERARQFAARIEAEDAAAGQALDLAALVQEIAWFGEEEREACRTMLRAFADYLRLRPDSVVSRSLAAMSDRRPAYSDAFAPGSIPQVEPVMPLEGITQEWAWGGSTGRGVKVAVIDSGIDADHPAIGGHVSGYVAITQGSDGIEFDTAPHGDLYGHGTACAGIIRSFAPDCELYSVRVLGSGLSGRGIIFAAGLRWAIEHGCTSAI